MSEYTQETLAVRLEEAKQKVAVGSQYRHYKDRLYTVLTIGLNEETLEPCVVYQAEYGEKLIWIRPISDWLKKVEWNEALVDRFVLHSRS